MGVKPDDKVSDVRLLDRIRSNPTGRLALKIGIGVVGALVVAVGIVLIPFPGPGWAIVILGLAILALEFAWAKNLLAFTRRHVKNWTHWIGRQSLGLRALLGIVGLVFVAAVVYFAARLSFGIDLIQVCQDLLDR
ncbi:TIGR02611 family protein [Actinoplanes regularis]|uniref:TIGR02611 family protein n=1 Tax=Actinoplanes regularis TaxID=52697 RepID=A0A239D8L8_9ACTN|nr:TIGR02611 family protein [Actinoplanes regularis]GIE88689.1 hypothetical protein Are01nite_51690 [Actinoplanes regularis]GLW32516.1 hypothetical protein Areg01_54540 [Actinoplanes regularis]SNS28181.1 TIGR02611 family protein [Actinoplanes regularis]